MSSPTSLRIPPEAKRRITAAARRRGMSTKQFMVDAALKDAEGTDWAKFFAAHPPIVPPKHARRDLSTHEGFGG
jgi:hypothetical protein